MKRIQFNLLSGGIPNGAIVDPRPSNNIINGWMTRWEEYPKISDCIDPLVVNLILSIAYYTRKRYNLLQVSKILLQMCRRMPVPNCCKIFSTSNIFVQGWCHYQTCHKVVCNEMLINIIHSWYNENVTILTNCSNKIVLTNLQEPWRRCTCKICQQLVKFLFSNITWAIFDQPRNHPVIVIVCV